MAITIVPTRPKAKKPKKPALRGKANSGTRAKGVKKVKRSNTRLIG